LRNSKPELFRKVRFHFVGTTYAPKGGSYLVMPSAREFGVEDIVGEIPRRVPHL